MRILLPSTSEHHPNVTITAPDLLKWKMWDLHVLQQNPNFMLNGIRTCGLSSRKSQLDVKLLKEVETWHCWKACIWFTNSSWNTDGWVSGVHGHCNKNNLELTTECMPSAQTNSSSYFMMSDWVLSCTRMRINAHIWTERMRLRFYYLFSYRAGNIPDCSWGIFFMALSLPVFLPFKGDIQSPPFLWLYFHFRNSPAPSAGAKCCRTVWQTRSNCGSECGIRCYAKYTNGIR